MVSIFTVAAFRPNASEIHTAMLLFVDAFSGAAFCFLINDVYDREKDLLNNKKRPIATGAVPLKVAIGAIVLFAMVYLVVSFLLGTTVFILAIISLTLFTLYSPVNNRGGFIANLLVALCASGSVWGVAIVRDYDLTLLYLSALIFILVLMREILLDWLDVPGDKAVGKPSIPILLGEKKTSWLLMLLLLTSTIIVLGAPVVVSISVYTIVALTCAVVATFIPLMSLTRKPTEKAILFNIRFSHVTFVLIVVGIILR